MSASQNDSTASNARRKKEAAGFIHDANARNDQRILRLRAKGGWAYYGLYFACIEVMREHTEYRIEREAIEAVALSLCVDSVQFESFLDTCVSIGLFIEDENGFRSQSLLERMERYEAAVEQRKAAGRASAERRLNGRSTAVESSLNAPNINRTRTITRTEPELDPGEVQEGEQAPPPQTLPKPYYDDPAEWSELRREAEEALQPVTDAISRAPGFVTLRRRPMRKYPELWLTGVELATVTERILEAGISIADRPSVFAKASAHAKKQIASGKEPSVMNAYGWLLGFCLTATLEEQTKSTQLATSAQYLKNARKK